MFSFLPLLLILISFCYPNLHLSINLLLSQNMNGLQILKRIYKKQIGHDYLLKISKFSSLIGDLNVAVGKGS